MTLPNIKDTWIRNNPWCKELRKTYNPDLLAALIQKRIDAPNIHGPFIQTKENATDIITSFIQDEDGFRKKIEPAVGLLLYNLKNDKIPQNNNLLRGLFNLIKSSKLVDCQQLTYNWLQENSPWLVSDDDSKKYTYREGMVAFAYIQKKDETVEHYWYNIWKEGIEFWWASAFLGLRIQNPKTAAVQLPLLISRKIDKTPQLIEGMWKDDNSRHQLQCSLKKALKENDLWAGLMVNQLLIKLNDDQKNELMVALK